MQNAILRHQKIIEYISDYRKTTRKDLAKMFGVNEKTIRRDIEYLTCSYPIYTAQGNGGGIFAMEGWRLNHKFLTEAQESLLRGLLPGLQPDDKAAMESILLAFAKPQIIDKEKDK